MIVMTCHDDHRSWGATDSIDEHTGVPDEVTLTTLWWRVKGLTTPDEDTGSFNMSKHFRRLPSQIVRPLEPIKAPLLGKGVTSMALTTHNGTINKRYKKYTLIEPSPFSLNILIPILTWASETLWQAPHWWLHWRNSPYHLYECWIHLEIIYWRGQHSSIDNTGLGFIKANMKKSMTSFIN